MKNDTYFERLDYTITPVHAVSAPPVCFFTESQTAHYMPIKEYLASLHSTQAAALFNFEKSHRERHCGLGQTLIQAVHSSCNSGFYLKIEDEKREQEQQTFFVHYCLTTAYPVLYDKNAIEIADNACACIILYCDSAANGEPAVPYYRNGILSISIGKHAAVEIIKIQNFADSAVNFETIRMDVQEKAQVTVHDIHLGSQKSGTSYASYIQEDNAEVHIYPLYFVDKTRRMDIEHDLIINGKNTIADITAQGAIKNNAHKIFRGNIFLNKGCCKSSARFSDNSIMLDKQAVGISIPTIFCDEDDVIGEHAASFLAIDKDKLYYLMSRGFDDASAKKLIIESAFRPVFNRIPNEHIRSKLNTEFDMRLAADL
ncbi:MAG: Fe-S cluster assembly protein SufD [Treponema sp.]